MGAHLNSDSAQHRFSLRGPSVCFVQSAYAAFFCNTVSPNNYSCEQLLSFMKNVKSRTKSHLTDEHLEGRMQIAITEIKHDTVGVLNQK
jgi:hypothetical protein